MKITRIRLPKVLLIGLLVSFVTMWLASGVLEVLVRYIPASPTAKIYQYLALNNNNMEVYSSSYYRNLAPQAGYLDAFICTPLAMLCSGLVFGIYAKRARLRRFNALVGGAVTGILFAVIVIGITWLLVTVDTSMASGSSPQFASFSMSPMELRLAAIELGLSAMACAAGAWLASGGRSDSAGSATGQSSGRLPQAKAF